MKECIICRKEKNDFSDEHVIPDALGGYYHIFSVCKECNSKLGSCVDTKLVKHLFSTFQRYSTGIKGKNGNIPNPFSGTHTLKNDKSQKVKLEMDENGQFNPYMITKRSESLINEKKSISLTFDKRDSSKLPKVLEKIAKRNNIKVEDMNISEDLNISQKISPEISIQLSVDFEEFKIGLLKIAYEFAVDSIPKYYTDTQAIVISKYLYNCKVKNNDLFLGSGLDTEVFKGIKWMLDLESNKQYLILFPTEEYGLICMIYLSEYISITVKLSYSKYLDQDFIIGINDIERKFFEKLNVNDITNRIYFPSTNRFQYWFQTEDEYIKFQYLEQTKKITPYFSDKKRPLYNRVGNIVYQDINNKINSLIHTDKIVETKRKNYDLVSEISLEDEELYIKFNNYLPLVRILKIRNEQIFKGYI